MTPLKPGDRVAVGPDEDRGDKYAGYAGHAVMTMAANIRVLKVSHD